MIFPSSKCSVVTYCSIVFLCSSSVFGIYSSDDSHVEGDIGINSDSNLSQETIIAIAGETDEQIHPTKEDSNLEKKVDDSDGENESDSHIKSQLQEIVITLKEEHERFADRMVNELKEIKSQMNINIAILSIPKLLELQHRCNPTRFSEGKQYPEHENQIRKIHGDQDTMRDTLQSIHHHVRHLSVMHNITERLKHTADLLIQERWYEASLHWSFAENHIRHDPALDANEIISQHLRTVVGFAFAGTGAEASLQRIINESWWNSREQIQIRSSRLIPIFNFVHKLSFKEYKVFAYETLIHQLLTDPLFDGWEIFQFSFFVRKNYGSNSKGQRLLPKLAQAVASGTSLKLSYVEFLPSNLNVFPRKEQTSLESSEDYDYYTLNEPPLNVTFDLHTKYDMVKKKNLDQYKSFQYPVYGSKVNTYKPPVSGTWRIEYQNNGFFAIKNGANEGYLNLPREISQVQEDDGAGAQLLNTVGDFDKDKFNLEFQLIFVSNSTFGIKAMVPAGRGAVIAGQCGERFARIQIQDEGQGYRKGRSLPPSFSLCFQVRSSSPGASNVTDERNDWKGAQFTVTSSSRI